MGECSHSTSHIIYHYVLLSPFNVWGQWLSWRNRIGGAMVSVLAFCVILRWFEHWRSQITMILVFAASPLSPHIKEYEQWMFPRNEDSVSEGSYIFTHGLLFQWASTLHIQLSVFFYYKTHIITIHLIKYKLFSLSWFCVKSSFNNMAYQRSCSLSISQFK